MNHGSSSAWAIVLTAASLDSTAAWAQRARHRPSHGRPSGVARPHRSDLRRAEALFHEGVAFADAQRWAEALDVFERSLALVPTASARFNVAVARLRLGRCLAATTAFEAHLASPEGDPNVARTARSRDLLAESRRCAATSAVGAAQAPGAASTETITRPTAPTLDAPAVRSALAAAAFARGRQALLARRNDEAADAFHEAVRIEPTAGTWRWLGVTLRGMARYTEAIAAFERYLAAPEADATAEQLAQAHVALAEMRRALGTLVVTVSPSRTTLLVDARPRSIGAGEVELDPGEHVVELRAEGYRTLREEINLRPGGQAVLNVRLEANAPSRNVPPPVAVEAAGPGAGPWAVVGVGGALLASAAVLYGLRGAALRDVNAVCDESTSICADNSRAQAETDYRAAGGYEVAAGVALGFGVAALAGGLLWRVLAPPASAPRRQAWNMIAWPSGGGATISVCGAL